MSLLNFDVCGGILWVCDIISVVKIIKFLFCDLVSQPLILNVLIVVDESISHALCDLLCMKALLVYLLIDLKHKRFRVRVALLLIFSCVSKSMTSKYNFFSVWLIIQTEWYKSWICVVKILLQYFLSFIKFSIFKFFTELDQIYIAIILVELI